MTVKVVLPGFIVAVIYVHVLVLSLPCILNLQFLHPSTLFPNVGNCLSKYPPCNVIVNLCKNLLVYVPAWN